MIPTSTEIEYFVEIFQTKHLSHAAIRLGITQPTLTQCLQKLESKIRAPLFVRTRQGMIATTAGKHFYSQAKGLLENWENVSGDISKVKNEISGRFKVGCHTAVGAYSIPPLMRNLNASAPGIELDFVHDFSRKITEQVVSFEIDLGFVINPVRHPDLVLIKLGDDRVTSWKKRGLARPPQRFITDASLVRIDELFNSQQLKKFSSWQICRSSSLELIRTMTLDGHGVGILPQRVARADSADLVIYDQSLLYRHDEIYLAYRPELLNTAAGKVLAKLAKIDLK